MTHISLRWKGIHYLWNCTIIGAWSKVSEQWVVHQILTRMMQRSHDCKRLYRFPCYPATNCICISWSQDHIVLNWACVVLMILWLTEVLLSELLVYVCDWLVTSYLRLQEEEEEEESQTAHTCLSHGRLTQPQVSLWDDKLYPINRL